MLALFGRRFAPVLALGCCCPRLLLLFLLLLLWLLLLLLFLFWFVFLFLLLLLLLLLSSLLLLLSSLVLLLLVLLVLATPDQSSGTVQLQCMGGCHHGGRWCGDTPLRTLGANARDAGYDSKGDALRRLAGCAPILWGSGAAAEGTWGHARQHRRPKGRREIPGRAPAASAPAGGCDSGRPAVSRCRCRGRRGGSVVGVGVVGGGVAVVVVVVGVVVVVVVVVGVVVAGGVVGGVVVVVAVAVGAVVVVVAEHAYGCRKCLRTACNSFVLIGWIACSDADPSWRTEKS